MTAGLSNFRSRLHMHTQMYKSLLDGPQTLAFERAVREPVRELHNVSMSRAPAPPIGEQLTHARSLKQLVDDACALAGNRSFGAPFQSERSRWLGLQTKVDTLWRDVSTPVAEATRAVWHDGTVWSAPRGALLTLLAQGPHSATAMQEQVFNMLGHRIQSRRNLSTSLSRLQESTASWLAYDRSARPYQWSLAAPAYRTVSLALSGVLHFVADLPADTTGEASDRTLAWVTPEAKRPVPSLMRMLMCCALLEGEKTIEQILAFVNERTFFHGIANVSMRYAISPLHSAGMIADNETSGYFHSYQLTPFGERVTKRAATQWTADTMRALDALTQRTVL